MNEHHVQHRESSGAVTHLEDGEAVVRTNEQICRLTSHLRTKHEQQFEISAARFLRVPPQSQSVRAGAIVWVLEQGKCSQNLGQQLVVHGAARRTVD